MIRDNIRQGLEAAFVVNAAPLGIVTLIQTVFEWVGEIVLWYHGFNLLCDSGPSDANPLPAAFILNKMYFSSTVYGSTRTAFPSCLENHFSLVSVKSNFSILSKYFLAEAKFSIAAADSAPISFVSSKMKDQQTIVIIHE